jgi:ParB family chromosome partitioning protein
MRAADRLGTGSSFGNVPRGRSERGRAKAITQGDIPAYELVRLQLNDVSPTPLNPRRNFGTAEELTRSGEELRAAQLAACVSVSRDVYLNLWPDHADRIGDVKHVLVNGSAATAVPARSVWTRWTSSCAMNWRPLARRS